MCADDTMTVLLVNKLSVQKRAHLSYSVNSQ